MYETNTLTFTLHHYGGGMAFVLDPYIQEKDNWYH